MSYDDSGPRCYSQENMVVRKKRMLEGKAMVRGDAEQLSKGSAGLPWIPGSWEHFDVRTLKKEGEKVMGVVTGAVCERYLGRGTDRDLSLPNDN